MKKVTKRDAEKVLAEVRRVFRPWIQGTTDGPELRAEFEWGSGTAPYAIVWEGGPFDWTMYVPFGGREEEFGFEITATKVPAGVYGAIPVHDRFETWESYEAHSR